MTRAQDMTRRSAAGRKAARSTKLRKRVAEKRLAEAKPATPPSKVTLDYIESEFQRMREGAE